MASVSIPRLGPGNIGVGIGSTEQLYRYFDDALELQDTLRDLHLTVDIVNQGTPSKDNSIRNVVGNRASYEITKLVCDPSVVPPPLFYHRRSPVVMRSVSRDTSLQHPSQPQTPATATKATTSDSVTSSEDTPSSDKDSVFSWTPSVHTPFSPMSTPPRRSLSRRRVSSDGSLESSPSGHRTNSNNRFSTLGAVPEGIEAALATSSTHSQQSHSSAYLDDDIFTSPAQQSNTRGLQQQKQQVQQHDTTHTISVAQSPQTPKRSLSLSRRLSMLSPIALSFIDDASTPGHRKMSMSFRSPSIRSPTPVPQISQPVQAAQPVQATQPIPEEHPEANKTQVPEETATNTTRHRRLSSITAPIEKTLNKDINFYGLRRSASATYKSGVQKFTGKPGPLVISRPQSGQSHRTHVLPPLERPDRGRTPPPPSPPIPKDADIIRGHLPKSLKEQGRAVSSQSVYLVEVIERTDSFDETVRAKFSAEEYRQCIYE
ncbi:hypothetical protein EJ08DRAFT_697194 [Tothia fuscella]|uniref:Uncharacterized protein n=1 Tax=Tothia fuscella TaxID=1048955 RepID=A0A9P4TZB1_9PEZI|nr:hypothetical protein EJ08DRAFT_697194 [Tothia fuscella]